MKPLFIFSLPRSGSTLLQKILGRSDKISTASEPWILLPFMYTLKSHGEVSEYWYDHARIAIKNFYDGFPNGKIDYMNKMCDFITSLYALRADCKAEYFLDKTPRYHLICEEIIELFPHGKFIFLWRNPLAIVASILQKWSRKRWKISAYNIDIYNGLGNLIRAYKKHEKVSHALNYENLVRNSTSELQKICRYLDINFCEDMITSFSHTRIPGKFGDKPKNKEFKSKISSQSIDEWCIAFNNAYRKRWAKSYLKWVNREALDMMGYNYDEIRERLLECKADSNWSIFQDIACSIITKEKAIIPTIMSKFASRNNTHNTYR